MVLCGQLCGLLFALDDLLNLELLHARKGFEDLNGQLRQLALKDLG